MPRTLFASALVASIAVSSLAPSAAEAQVAPPGQWAPPGQYGPPPGQYAPPGQYPQQYPGTYSQQYPGAYPQQYPAPYPQQYPAPYPQQPQYTPPPADPPWGQLGITAHLGYARNLTTSVNGFGFGGGIRTWAFQFPLDVGLAVESDRFEDDRADYRAHAQLFATGWKRSWFNPYLVGAAGVNVITLPGRDPFFQGSLSGGVGLGLKIWRIGASAEARISYRAGDGDTPFAEELVGEARLNLAIYPFDL